MLVCAPEALGDLVARNERGQTVRVEVPWVVAVVSDRVWDMTLLYLIDGQRLTVDEPFEVVVAIVQGVLVTMH